MKVTGIIIAAMIVLFGMALLVVPSDYEGPLLLYINRHAICPVDAPGLILVIPSWFFLNWIGLRRLHEVLQKHKIL